jgi:hypothetical protein
MMRFVALCGAVGAAAAWPHTESQCLGKAGSYGNDKQCLPSVRRTRTGTEEEPAVEDLCL